LMCWLMILISFSHRESGRDAAALHDRGSVAFD
jgi:hypothetical protein